MKYMGMLALGCIAICALGQSPSWPLTLQQAESRFLSKNLILLAQRYQIDEASALAYQQRLFSNPEFESEWSVHGGNGKWFDLGRNGQKAMSIEQVFELAGKRKKRMQLAAAETTEASLNFEEVLRQLKYELREQFYQLAYDRELLALYKEQIDWLDKIIHAYDEQTRLRNVSLKDAIRLKSERIQLLSLQTELASRMIESNGVLQVLLDSSISLQPQKLHDPTQIELPTLQQLVDSALQHRPDLRLSLNEMKQAEVNLSLQKAMATPDIRLGAAYDQQGNYTNNLYSFRFAVPLPLFNRNQGNIKAAQFQVKSAQLLNDFRQREVARQVAATVDKIRLAEQSYQESLHIFNSDLNEVNRAVQENFNKGNISLLEFLDFFENYNEAIRQLNELHRQRRMAYEELEFTVGVQISFTTNN